MGDVVQFHAVEPISFAVLSLGSVQTPENIQRASAFAVYACIRVLLFYYLLFNRNRVQHTQQVCECTVTVAPTREHRQNGCTLECFLDSLLRSDNKIRYSP